MHGIIQIVGYLAVFGGLAGTVLSVGFELVDGIRVWWSKKQKRE
jgi:hypothetical protein